MRRPDRRKAACRQAGFSLIEVLAALIIVSLGMLGVIEAVTQTAGNTAYLRDKTIAHWIAMNRLTEMRLAQQAPSTGKTSDEVEMAQRRWRWTAEVSQTQLESMRRIDVRVRREEDDDDYSLATVTGFFGSAIAPAGTTVVQWDGSGGGLAPGGDGSRRPDRPDRDAPADNENPPNNGEGDSPNPSAGEIIQ